MELNSAISLINLSVWVQIYSMKLELIVHKNSSLQGSPKVSKATLSSKVR